MRFILQPMLAIVLGIRGGLADAKAGNPPYLFGLLFGAGRRKELLRTGAEAIGTLLAMGIILDVVFQFVLYRSVHPAHPVALGEEVSILFSWRRVRYHSRFILHEAEDANKKPERERTSSRLVRESRLSALRESLESPVLTALSFSLVAISFPIWSWL